MFREALSVPSRVSVLSTVNVFPETICHGEPEPAAHA
jgi:hypothetical protein